MSVDRVFGAILLAISTLSFVQTVRALVAIRSPQWTTVYDTRHTFSFVGRTIRIIKPADTDVAADQATVPQERVLIDGRLVGVATDRRMSTWRLNEEQRPFAVLAFIWFPYLWLVYPIGTGILGFVLFRQPRVRDPLR